MFAANKEYYHQWSVEECHGCSLDLSAFTIEELDNITSEYTLKNTVSSHSYSAVSRSSNEGRPDTVPVQSFHHYLKAALFRDTHQ